MRTSSSHVQQKEGSHLQAVKLGPGARPMLLELGDLGSVGHDLAVFLCGLLHLAMFLSSDILSWGPGSVCGFSLGKTSYVSNVHVL